MCIRDRLEVLRAAHLQAPCFQVVRHRPGDGGVVLNNKNPVQRSFPPCFSSVLFSLGLFYHTPAAPSRKGTGGRQMRPPALLWAGPVPLTGPLLQQTPVGSDSHNLPRKEFPAVSQCGFHRLLQPAAAGYLHAHHRNASNVVFAQNIRQFPGIIHPVQPVSYTHLDVYKRQPCGRMG